MLNEHVTYLVLYIYSTVQLTDDPEVPPNMGYYK